MSENNAPNHNESADQDWAFVKSMTSEERMLYYEAVSDEANAITATCIRESSLWWYWLNYCYFQDAKVEQIVSSSTCLHVVYISVSLTRRANFITSI